MARPEPVFLSIVIPVYNEEKRLNQAFSDVLPYLKSFPKPWEIVVVDDGSRDQTVSKIEQYQTQEPRIKLIKLPINQGKGAAVKVGMLAAQGQYRLFRDADSSTEMKEWPRFLGELEKGAQVVIASRHAEGAGIERHQGFIRENLGKGFVLISRILLVWEIKDFTCGFKCFEAKAAQEIFSRQRIDRWAFDSEILFIAHKMGYRIVQAPVLWRDEAGSKVRVLKDVIGSFTEILRILFYYLRGCYKIPR